MASPSTRPAERQVPAGDDALEGRKTKKVRSGAVTLRRAARKGPFCIVPLQIGDSSGCSRTEIRLAVLEGTQEAISVDRTHRSHPLNAFALAASVAFVPVRTLSACMPLSLPVSQSMRAIPECPNDAFQLLMSCAQATARRDAETGGESGLP